MAAFNRFAWPQSSESAGSTGETHATIAEITEADRIRVPYVGRVLRHTLFAADIVEAILGGRQPAVLQLDGLMRRFPVGWREQRQVLERIPVMFERSPHGERSFCILER